MDENESMDPSIIKSLFEQGVCCSVCGGIGLNTQTKLRCFPVDGY